MYIDFFFQNKRMWNRGEMVSHFDLAGATHSGCSSGKVPFPIGVGRNGSLQPSTSCFSSFSHWAYAAPDKILKCFSL